MLLKKGTKGVVKKYHYNNGLYMALGDATSYYDAAWTNEFEKFTKKAPEEEKPRVQEENKETSMRNDKTEKNDNNKVKEENKDTTKEKNKETEELPDNQDKKSTTSIPKSQRGRKRRTPQEIREDMLKK